MSSAEGDALSFEEAILSGELTLSTGPPAEGRSRKGFLDVGLGGGSSKGELGAGERAPGDTARLRKGLFDPRFKVRPGLLE